MKPIISIIFLFIMSISLYAGNCIYGDCKEGRGAMIYSDGSQYIGDWENGKRHGTGLITLPDGSEYVGSFKNGLPDGQGKLTAADGSESYMGEFKKGQYDGMGTLFTRSGVKSGKWKDGIYIGSGK